MEQDHAAGTLIAPHATLPEPCIGRFCPTPYCPSHHHHRFQIMLLPVTNSSLQCLPHLLQSICLQHCHCRHQHICLQCCSRRKGKLEVELGSEVKWRNEVKQGKGKRENQQQAPHLGHHHKGFKFYLAPPVC